MCAKKIQKERNKQYEERHVLAVGRLRGIVSEETVPEQYLSYFQDVAIFLLELENVRRKVESGEWNRYSVDEMRSINEILYSDILGDRYEKSFGNPAFAVEQFGPEMGRMLCLLYAEMRSGIPYSFENRVDYLTILSELFIEVYNCMTVKIRFRNILFSVQRDRIIFCHDLLTIRIVDTDILTPRITGIAHRKMRAGFFCDEDRHLVFDTVFLSRHISCRIGTDGKFPERQRLMPL